MTSALRRHVYIVKEGCPVQPWPEELLERYHIFVRSFATAADCLAALQECPCALLVVSLDGGPEAGLRLLTQAGQLHPLMFSIAVVHIGDVHMAVRAMKAGAHDCVEKPVEGKWWLMAIEKAAAKWQRAHRHSNGTLTETEKFVLRQVLAGKTSKEIAWMLHRSPRTVEVHRTHIIQKLGVSSTVDLIRQAVTLELQDALPSS